VSKYRRDNQQLLFSPTITVPTTCLSIYNDPLSSQYTTSNAHSVQEKRVYHHSGLVGDVAVPVSARQVVLSYVFLNPDARPWLNGCRSASTVLSQVCLGRPRRRFQFLGLCHMHVLRAREWSWDLSARATWPNILKRLAHTISDSKGCPVRLRISEFVTCSDHVMFAYQFLAITLWNLNAWI